MISMRHFCIIGIILPLLLSGSAKFQGGGRQISFSIVSSRGIPYSRGISIVSSTITKRFSSIDSSPLIVHNPILTRISICSQSPPFPIVRLIRHSLILWAIIGRSTASSFSCQRTCLTIYSNRQRGVLSFIWKTRHLIHLISRRISYYSI